MITSNLFQHILIDPVRLGAEELHVVTGYASAAMALNQLDKTKELTGRDVTVKLVVGMTAKDGISKVNHLGFQRLSTVEFAGQFSCGYLPNLPPVHSKVYAWLKGGKPFRAFVGSANYSQNAFGGQEEAVVISDPIKCDTYFRAVLATAVDCNDARANRLLNLYNPSVSRTLNTTPTPQERQLQARSGIPNILSLPKVCVSFLAHDGSLPQISGLNWGQRAGREPNQAYIPLPASVYRTNFFPPIAEHFTVLTDDNQVLHSARAQQNGKAIHTYRSNSEMGIYFRGRLNVPRGQAVQKADLTRYGRYDVCFYKIDDETFFMDFS